MSGEIPTTTTPTLTNGKVGVGGGVVCLGIGGFCRATGSNGWMWNVEGATVRQKSGSFSRGVCVCGMGVACVVETVSTVLA